MIIAYRAGSRAVFLYGFAKNERTNISEEELLTLRTIGANWLSAPMAVLRLALTRGDLREIEHDKEKS